MGSLIDELQRREAAARAEAEELRGRIAELTERLARAGERLSRLVIAREAADWLAERCGDEQAAPAELGGGGLEPIGEAPGTYVYDH
jgi:poly(3-hydroxyalkanoate) synthetase